MMIIHALFTLFLFTPSAMAEGVGKGTGLEVSVAGDLVGSFGANADNRMDAREAELQFFAPIDHLFDGVASLAAHNESGKYFFEIHQLTIGSAKLIPRSRFRVGQYFLGVGRLNQFHRHDWPFISAPKVHSTFFAEEGLRDSGVEYSWLLPTPLFLDLTLGVTNGWVLGHSHDQGTRPHVPTHYARLVTYSDIFSDGGLQVGLNYLGRKDNNSKLLSLIGLDATAKWRKDKVLKFLLQSEVWYQSQSPRDTPSEKRIGFYLYPQIGLSEAWYLGLRLDGFSVLSREDAGGNRIGNFDYGVVPTVTVKASEFSTIRAAYNLLGSLGQGEQQSAQTLEVQAVFLLGSHRSHDF